MVTGYIVCSKFVTGYEMECKFVTGYELEHATSYEMELYLVYSVTSFIFIDSKLGAYLLFAIRSSATFWAY